MKLITTATIGIFAFALLGFQQGDGVLLRRALTENAEDKYTMEMKTSAKIDLSAMGMGEMPMTITMGMNLSMKTGKQDQETKKFALDATMSDLKLDMGEMGAMMAGANPMDNMPKEMVVKGTIDERNKIVLSKTGIPGMEMAGMMMGGGADPLSMLAIEFPEKAMRVGDTWEMTIPKNPMMGNKEIKSIAKLIGEKKVGEVDCYQIEVTFAAPIDADMAEIMKSMGSAAGGGADAMAGMKILIKGKIESKSEVFVSKKDGKTVKMDTLMRSTQTIELPDMGQSINSSGETTMKMEIAK